MAVHIRLARLGRTHRPFYRVVAIDSRCHREGKANEVLGTYDPLKAEKNIEVAIERVHAWVRAGAQLSESVASLLKREGYEVLPAEVKEAKAKRRAKRRADRKGRKNKDGTKFVPASRRAKLKHQLALKKERLAKEAEAAATHKAEQEAAAAKAAEAEAAAAPAEGEAETAAEETSES